MSDTPRPPMAAGHLASGTAWKPAVQQRPVERAAWAFYAVAAAGSTVGQVWVAVDTPPWPETTEWWIRGLLVLPFAIVIDLGGVVSAAFADVRRRLGEAAYGWRILSAGSVILGVGINVVGHWHVPYLAAVFGGLGTFAYTVWTLHSAARRRDALRATGKLADTGPIYGIGQWLRQPAATRRARTLALQQGYPVHESLITAQQQLREERRTTALSRHIQKLIRARHDDPIVAEIAGSTLDVAAIAARLTATADIDGWTRVIGADLTPPGLELATPPVGHDSLDIPKDIMRRIPVHQDDYDQWRRIWEDWQNQPATSHKAVAQQRQISERQAQWIRAAGNLHLLDEPTPPLVSAIHIIQANRSRASSRP